MAASVEGTHVVLATGHQPPATPRLRIGGWPEDPRRFVADPWAPDADLGELAAGTILLVGTGLTMVDVAIQLARDPQRRLVAVSRHGLIPKAHVAAAGPRVPVAAPAPGTSLRGLVRHARAAAREAVDSGGDWRDAVDALRSSTPALWAALSVEEQRTF